MENWTKPMISDINENGESLKGNEGRGNYWRFAKTGKPIIEVTSLPPNPKNPHCVSNPDFEQKDPNNLEDDKNQPDQD